MVNFPETAPPPDPVAIAVAAEAAARAKAEAAASKAAAIASTAKGPGPAPHDAMEVPINVPSPSAEGGAVIEPPFPLSMPLEMPDYHKRPADEDFGAESKRRAIYSEEVQVPATTECVQV